MKKKSKINIIILIALLIFFTLSSLINNYNLIFNMGNRNNNSEYYDNVNLNNENLKLSKKSGKIHIINNSGWADFKNDGNCTGSGTYSDPYVIEDLVIDGGGSGSCIWIENSNVYFRIENCTLYYSGRSPNAGIRLDYVNNSQLIDNNYSSNVYGNMIGFYFGIRLLNCNNNTISGNTVNKNDYGMALYYCSNNTISRNTANNNHFSGIDLGDSDNNIISGNTANYNGVGIGLVSSSNNIISRNTVNNNNYGIYLLYSDNNTISGNIMNECGLLIYGTIEALVSNDIDTTNLVNEKPLYYYTNEVNLQSNDFANAGQVILVNCNDSFLSNLNISYTHYAISLHYCNNNMISGNTVNNNNYGIYLLYSDNNTISGNTANYNGVGIYLGYSDNNIISGNTVNYNYGDGIRIRFSDIKTISGNKASYNDYGIVLGYSNNTAISGNTVNNNNYGIYLTRCNYSTISGNMASNNKENGISLYGNDNKILGNIIKNNVWSGITLRGDNNTISGNIATNSTENGISIYGNNNRILGNIINNHLNNHYGSGISISGGNNTISGNIMNGCGLRIKRWHNKFFFEELISLDIDNTNLVNGKPLYYYSNEINLQSNDFMNAGQVILVNCNDSLISDLDTSYWATGITLYYCNNNEITGNTVNNKSGTGIYLYRSNDNVISENSVYNNNYYGISIGGDRNKVLGNIVYNNSIGIGIFGYHNKIWGNNVYNNNDGIKIVGSNNMVWGNTIYTNDMGILFSTGVIWPRIPPKYVASSFNFVSENLINYNQFGIYLSYGDNNTVSGNVITYNDYGIYLYSSDYNIISENTVNDNFLIGIALIRFCIGTIIYLNCFNNILNAVDNCSNNYWNNGLFGNYWADYTGLDADGNGIGDVPYVIAGSAGSQDNFPLMKCPLPLIQLPFELIILISTISGGAVIGLATLLLIRRKRIRKK